MFVAVGATSHLGTSASLGQRPLQCVIESLLGRRVFFSGDGATGAIDLELKQFFLENLHERSAALGWLNLTASFPQRKPYSGAEKARPGKQ